MNLRFAQTALVSMAAISALAIPVAGWAAVVDGCGDFNGDGVFRSSDALAALATSVDAGTCRRCVCDVDSSGEVLASDALQILRAAVELPVALACPLCDSGCGDGILAEHVAGTFAGQSLVMLCDDADDPTRACSFVFEILLALDQDLKAVEAATVDDVLTDSGDFCALRRADSNSGPAPASATQNVFTRVSNTTSTTYCYRTYDTCELEVSINSPVSLSKLVLSFGNVGNQRCRTRSVEGATSDLDDGVLTVDSGVLEECDDGNTVPGDGCARDCTIETYR